MPRNHLIPCASRLIRAVACGGAPRCAVGAVSSAVVERVRSTTGAGTGIPGSRGAVYGPGHWRQGLTRGSRRDAAPQQAWLHVSWNSPVRDAGRRIQGTGRGVWDTGRRVWGAARRTHPENRPRARNGRPHAGGRTGLRDATTLRRCAPPPASGRRMTIAPQCVCGLIGVFCQREGSETAAARPYAPPCIELVYRIICGVYAACMRRFRQNARIASRVGCVAA